MPIEADDVPFRPDPRLVPTLTEVVRQVEPEVHDSLQEPPGAAAQADSPSVQAAGGPAGEAVVPPPALPTAQILARLGDELDRRLDEAVARVLHEQMGSLTARVRAAVVEAAQAAVAEAEASQRGLSDSDASRNP
ncbi:MAG TPA: hypothetical protein PKA16_03860 [Ottowia sp.]|uniref:hypothetical protein n=1 Tax=Ottowia sp. TaxID=1898956 RepID=UPI002CC86DBD|nr:hypothetical protein [Ottowia sp.]HMN20509.1 hypothetical protein [Ottowia sp.]